MLWVSRIVVGRRATMCDKFRRHPLKPMRARYLPDSKMCGNNILASEALIDEPDWGYPNPQFCNAIEITQHPLDLTIPNSICHHMEGMS